MRSRKLCDAVIRIRIHVGSNRLDIKWFVHSQLSPHFAQALKENGGSSRLIWLLWGLTGPISHPTGVNRRIEPAMTSKSTIASSSQWWDSLRAQSKSGWRYRSPITFLHQMRTLVNPIQKQKSCRMALLYTNVSRQESHYLSHGSRLTLTSVHRSDLKRSHAPC